MSKQISTQSKPKKSGLLKAGTLTFALAIIGLIIAAGMAIMRVAPAIVGLIMLIILVFIILLCSAFTAFII
ncbi:MAG: hypothetical protein MJ233_00625 [Mycoplasmoidaceae bacterium]|nr:hypothetical protein [Mycoplasmoidaceae bacterium]